MAAVAVPARGDDRDRLIPDDRTLFRGPDLGAGLSFHRCRTSRSRPNVLCILELHDIGLRRHHPSGTLAVDWADDRDEWSAIIRLVDRGHLRSITQNDPNSSSVSDVRCLALRCCNCEPRDECLSRPTIIRLKTCRMA